MRIEKRFLSNLNARDIAAEAANNSSPDSVLTPWDAHLADYVVNPLAPFVGRTLKDLAWRELYGINIALIKRGDKLIYAPNRNEILYPLDKVSIIGTDEQLQLFRPVIESAEEVPAEEQQNGNISLQKFIVDEHNKLKGQTIHQSGIRERTHGLVVGIERNGNRLLNPDSSEVLQWEDVVWIVGDRKKILALTKKDEGNK